MAHNHETAKDAITADEMLGTGSKTSSNKKRNAFDNLMSPKSKKPAATPSRQARSSTSSFTGRDGLGAYIQHPDAYPSRVIYHTESFVAIHDMFPKATVHTLLLPRGPEQHMHPFDAFENADFLSSVRAELPKLIKIVASELRRLHGPYSAQDKMRERILNGEEDMQDGQDLPKGRNWEDEVMVGIHAHPSMSHLHVHVLSKDRYSKCLKHRKHYNSFSTPFFVDIEAFPLAKDDMRRHPGKAGYLESDFKCWKCSRTFGNKFKQLQEHLDEEFIAWRKE